MKYFPFATSSGLGAAGAPSTDVIVSMYGRKINLRGFQFTCPPIPSVTGLATLVVSGVTDTTQPGAGVDNGQMTFTFTPSTTEVVTVALDFAEGCVESFSGVKFTVTPNGADDLSSSLINSWGQLIPIGE